MQLCYLLPSGGVMCGPDVFFFFVVQMFGVPSAPAASVAVGSKKVVLKFCQLKKCDYLCTRV